MSNQYALCFDQLISMIGTGGTLAFSVNSKDG